MGVDGEEERRRHSSRGTRELADEQGDYSDSSLISDATIGWTADIFTDDEVTGEGVTPVDERKDTWARVGRRDVDVGAEGSELVPRLVFRDVGTSAAFEEADSDEQGGGGREGGVRRCCACRCSLEADRRAVVGPVLDSSVGCDEMTRGGRAGAGAEASIQGTSSRCAPHLLPPQPESAHGAPPSLVGLPPLPPPPPPPISSVLGGGGHFAPGFCRNSFVLTTQLSSRRCNPRLSSPNLQFPPPPPLRFCLFWGEGLLRR